MVAKGIERVPIFCAYSQGIHTDLLPHHRPFWGLCDRKYEEQTRAGHDASVSSGKGYRDKLTSIGFGQPPAARQHSTYITKVLYPS